MDAPLTALIDDLRALTRDAEQFAVAAEDTAFARRPAPLAWSAAECLMHLNITNRAMLPVIDRGIDRGRLLGPGARPRYVRDPLGWLLCMTLEPPVRWTKTPTLKEFIPGAAAPREVIAREFAELNDALIQRIHDADGLQWGQIIVQSLFNKKIKYNLYSAYRITTAHERRHLWQAKRAMGGQHL